MSGMFDQYNLPGDTEDATDDEAYPDPRPPKEEHSGQVRMAYRLAKAYTNRLLYVHGIGWFYWDRKRWAFDDCGFAKRAVLDVLKVALGDSILDQTLRKDVGKCETANGIAGVLAIAAAMSEFACTVSDLDADPWLFNVANGTLDLRTMELGEHDPADRITKVTLGAYDPDAPATASPSSSAGEALADRLMRPLRLQSE